jgi:hypothetical protein
MATGFPRLASFTQPALALLLLAAPAAPAAADAGIWSPTGLQGNIQALAVAPGQPGIVYAAVREQGLFRSTDGGATWTAIDQGLFDACYPIGSDVYLLVADPRQPGTLYASTIAGLKKSTDGGATWQQPYAIKLGAVDDLALVPSVPGRLLAAVQALGVDPPGQCLGGGLTGLAVSADGGATWSNPVVDQVLAVAVDPTNLSRVFTEVWTGQPLVHLSEDGGATSTLLPPLPSFLIAGGPDALVVDPTTTPSTLFVRDPGYPGQIPGTIYRAAPGAGGTGGSPFWTLATNGLPANARLSDLLVDPAVAGRLYAATDAGVFESSDRGDNWFPSAGANPPAVALLAIDPRPLGPLYAGTSQGVYVLDRGGCAAGGNDSCLQASRFRVETFFQLPGGRSANGLSVPLTDDASAFWFFDPSNLEVLVKVLDGRAVNGNFWVFSGGLSNLEYTVLVTDVVTGAVKSYHNPPGQLSSFADTSAFSVSGPRSRAARAEAGAGTSAATRALPNATANAAGCTSGAASLCLGASRFRVEVSFQAPGLSGAGQAVPLTGDTGAWWFLTPDNLELAVKVLDGRGVNGHFWLFSAGMSDLFYTLTVTDTSTGTVKTYTNPAGHLGSFADTMAF